MVTDGDHTGQLTALLNSMKTQMKTTADEVFAAYTQKKHVLNRRESDIVSRYYGFGKHRRHTLQEIGNEYTLTRERVRQIKSNALVKLNVK